MTPVGIGPLRRHRMRVRISRTLNLSSAPVSPRSDLAHVPPSMTVEIPSAHAALTHALLDAPWAGRALGHRARNAGSRCVEQFVCGWVERGTAS